MAFKVDLQICIFSHLNDAKIEMSFSPDQANTRIEFVKFLVRKYMPEVSIDISQDWEDFKKEFFKEGAN